MLLDANAEDFVRQIRLHDGEVSLPDGNVTMPYMLMEILSMTTEWWVGYFNDEEEDSPWEAGLELKANLGVMDGLKIGMFVGSLFPDLVSWDYHEDRDGNLSIRLLGND